MKDGLDKTQVEHVEQAMEAIRERFPNGYVKGEEQFAQPRNQDSVWRQVKRQQLLTCLAKGLNIKESADAIGCSAGVLYKMVREPLFQEEVRTRSATAYDKIISEIEDRAANLSKRVEALSVTALDTLEELMMDTAQPGQVRQKAAADILDRNPDVTKTHKVESTSRQISIDPRFLQMAAETAQQESSWPLKKETVQ